MSSPPGKFDDLFAYGYLSENLYFAKWNRWQPDNAGGPLWDARSKRVWPAIDSKVWRAYGWRSFNGLESLPLLFPAREVRHEAWQMVRDSRVVEAPI